MDLKKKKAFNQRMGKGKFPRHQNLADGGMVKHFDAGGNVPVAPGAVGVSGPTTAGVNQNASGPQGVTGAVSNLLGTNNNFQAGSANLQPGTNGSQLNAAYSGAQGALGTQAGLTNTLMPGAASGVASQNALANQYLAMTQGQGPNPAQAQLAQSTGQNVANQAALMAGQRGAGSNVGLLARQAAQQGAATQQQAVGQGATLEAQQQIAAQQNLANLAAQQVGQAGTATTALNTAQQNEQNILQNANTSLNNANVGMQSNINNTNATVAAGNQQQNSGILGGLAGAGSSVLGAIGSLFAKGGEVQRLAPGGEISANPLVTAPTSSAAAPNWAGQYMSSPASSGPNVQPMSAPQADPASAFSDAYTAASDAGNSAIKTAQAGQAVNKMNQGVASADASIPQAPPELGAELNTTPAPSLGFASGGQVYHRNYFHEYFSGGGMSGRAVDAIVSPKEVYLNPRQVKEVVERGADPMKIGHHFPGKDKVGRDSLKNDVIKTKLEEGGVVLPIHITTHKDSSHRGRKFVERTVAKHMKKPSGA